MGDLPDPAGAGGEDGDAGGSNGSGGKAAGGSGEGGGLPSDGGAGGAQTGGKSGATGGAGGTGGTGTGGGIITDGGSPGTGGLDGGPDASDGGFDGGTGGTSTGGAATGGSGGSGGIATGGAGTGGTATGGTATGGAATGGATTGGSNGTGGVVTCTTDADQDGKISAACGGEDCDDSNGAVFKGQSNFFDVATPKGNYDYDCNSVPEKDPALDKASVCTGLLSLGGCNLTTNSYIGTSAHTSPGCGVAGPWGKCVKDPGLGLNCIVGATTQVKMACH